MLQLTLTAAFDTIEQLFTLRRNQRIPQEEENVKAYGQRQKN